MNLHIDDHIADDITIKNLEDDLDVLKRTLNSCTDENDPDFIFSTEVIKAIETVLAYYGKA